MYGKHPYYETAKDEQWEAFVEEIELFLAKQKDLDAQRPKGRVLYEEGRVS